jgi:LmbE family N-acetylglucosaminyl deacetylase
LIWSNRPRVERAKDHASQLAESAWRLAFKSARKLIPPTVVEAPTKPETVLVVAPHPDDEAIGCAGAVLSHRARGDSVHLVIATDGGAAGHDKLDRQAMALARRAEAERASRLLDAHLEYLGLPEFDWATSDLECRLARLIAEISPSLVYAPISVDGHPEHRRVAGATAVALAGRQARVRVVQIHLPLTPVLSNLALDVSPFQGQILEVLEAYSTQRYIVSPALRLRRYAAELYGFESMGEVFWETSVPEFERLAAAPPTPYHGVRPRAFRDPLAFLSGLTDRRALRERVSESTGPFEVRIQRTQKAR